MSHLSCAASRPRAVACFPLLFALCAIGCGNGHDVSPGPGASVAGHAGVSEGANPAGSGGAGRPSTDGPRGSDPDAGDPSGIDPATFNWLNVDENGAALDDVLGQRAASLIEQRCGSCHAEGAAAPVLGPASRLFATGLAIPGNSLESPLIVTGTQLGHDGSNPSRPLLTPGEIALLRRFVDDASIEPRPCVPVAVVDTDAALAVMASDAAALPEADRPFVRYATLTYASNVGVCGDTLQRERSALRLGLNSASTGPRVALPQAIDADQLIYRFDLRDYGWERALDLDGDGSTETADAWSAIIGAAGPYAVTYTGPEANALGAATQTAVPFLPGNALVHAIAGGDLYYALIGVPRSLDRYWLGLGIDYQAPLIEGGASIAGSSIAGRETEVMRITSSAEAPIWSIAESRPDDSESPFSNPAGLFDGTPEYITRLPNGLQAYLVIGDAGEREASASPHDRCGDPSCAKLPIAACSACHDQGLLPIVDEVRALLLRVGDEVFSPEELSEALELHPPQPELDELLAADSRVDAEARAALIAGAPGRDPLSRLYFGFERNGIAGTQAAAELGVTAAALEQSALDLVPFTTRRIDRSAFSAVYRAALCRLLAGARNPPRCAEGADAGPP